MLGIKQSLLNRWAPDYDLLQQNTKLLGFYERFFPKFLDPQVVQNKLADLMNTHGEVKDVCVMFTDVRGFTKFAEKSSLQASNSLLNNFYDIVIHHTQTNGGIVDKFIGDGTMSIFGVYDEQPDYAARSVAAAQGILRDFTQMTQQKHEPSLFLGLGLSKGPAIVGMFGNGDYVSFTAIGHTVNLAARVQAKAEDNNILVTKEVASCLDSEEFHSKGRFELKNVSRKIELFEIGL